MAEEYSQDLQQENLQAEAPQVEEVQQETTVPSTNGDDPPYKKLWKGLVSEGLYSGKFDDFQKKYSTPQEIEKLHKGLIEEDLYSKGVDDFYSQYFPDVKKKDGQVGGQDLQIGGKDGNSQAPLPSPLTLKDEQQKPKKPAQIIIGETEGGILQDDAITLISQKQQEKKKYSAAAGNENLVGANQSQNKIQDIDYKLNALGVNDKTKKELDTELGDFPWGKNITKRGIKFNPEKYGLPKGEYSLPKILSVTREQDYPAYVNYLTQYKIGDLIEEKTGNKKGEVNDFLYTYESGKGEIPKGSAGLDFLENNSDSVKKNITKHLGVDGLGMPSDETKKGISIADDYFGLEVYTQFNDKDVKDFIQQKLDGTNLGVKHKENAAEDAIKYGVDDKGEINYPAYNSSEDLDNYDLNSIKSNLDLSNPVVAAAFNKYSGKVLLSDVLGKKTQIDDSGRPVTTYNDGNEWTQADFENAAINYAATQEPLIAKQMQELNGEIPDNMKGDLLQSFLDNPSLKEEIKNSPELAKIYQEVKNGFRFKYKDANVNRISTTISQGLEDMGGTNWLVNVPTKDQIDEVVNKLKLSGKLSDTDIDDYYNNIRPTVGVGMSLLRGTVGTVLPGFVDPAKVKTGGIIENIQESYRNQIKNTAKGIEDVATIASPISVFPDEQQRLYNVLTDKYNTMMLNFKPVHEWSSATGNVVGFMIPLIAGGAVLEGMGAGQAGEYINTILAFEGQNRDKAIEYFPGDTKNQILYTALSTAGDATLGKLLPQKGFSKYFKNETKALIEKLSSGAITQSEATIAFKSATNKVTQLLGKNAKTAAVMQGFGLYHELVDKVFGAGAAKDASVMEMVYDKVKNYKTTFLSTLVLSGAETLGSGNQKVNHKILWEMANSPEKYEKLVNELAQKDANIAGQKQDMLFNLSIASNIANDLNRPEIEISTKQKQKYLTLGVQKDILLRKATSITDVNISQKYVKQAEALNEKQKEILDNKDKADELKSYDVSEDSKVEEVVPEVKVEAEVPKLKEGDKVYRVEYYDTDAKKMSSKLFSDEEAGKKFEESLNSAQRSFGTKRYYDKYDGKEEIVQPEATKIEEEVPDLTVGDLLDKTGKYKNQDGLFYLDGQTVVFKVEGQNKEYELGNINEIKDSSVKDFGIEHKESVVTIGNNGELIVRGKEYKNRYSDPLMAINRDANGNVIGVTLETTNGNKRRFKGNTAEDIAYQIHLQEITKNNETRQFEEFINEPEQQQQIDNGAVPEVTSERTVATDEPIQREKIEPIQQSEQATSEVNTQTEIPQQKEIEGVGEEVVPKLKDIESTAKALEDKLKEGGRVDEDGFQYRNEKKVMPIVDTFTDKMSEDYQTDVFINERKTPEQFVSEAYHKAKADGSNPELVKAVEDLIGKKAELPKQKKKQPKGKAAKFVAENLAEPDSEGEGTPKPEPPTKEKTGEEILKELENKGTKSSDEKSLKELADKNKGNKVKRKIIEQARKAIKTLKSIFPNMDIHLHENEQEYNDVMEKVKGKQSSGGNFAYTKNADGTYSVRIDINLNAATSTTVAHEVTHAILFKAFGENQEVFQSFRDKISKVLGSATEKGLKDFADSPFYKAQGVTAEEYLSELSGLLSSKTINPLTLSKIASAINEFVSKVTGGKFIPFENVNDAKDVIEFFDNVSKAIKKGNDLTNIGKEKLVENAETQARIKSKSQTEKLFKADKDEIEKILDKAGKNKEGKKWKLSDVATVISKYIDKKKVFDKPIEEVSDKEFVSGIKKETDKELKAWEESVGGKEYVSFYKNDITDRLNPKLQQFAEKRYGRKLTPEEISLYHLVSAFASPEATPEFDSSKGLEVFDKYMKTGNLSGLSDKQATIWALNEKGVKEDTGVPKFAESGEPVMSKWSKGYADYSLDKFKNVIDYFNGDLGKAIEWAQSIHSYEEISNVMGIPLKGDKALKPHENLTKQNGGFGIFGFTGAKLGSYALNRMGEYSTVTKDMWYARTMARLSGESMFDEKGDAVKRPWAFTVEDVRKRKLADKAWEEVAKKKGLSPSDIQERMWDYEKRLWEKLGAVESASYASDGFMKQAKVFEPDIKFTEPAPEQKIKSKARFEEEKGLSLTDETKKYEQQPKSRENPQGREGLPKSITAGKEGAGEERPRNAESYSNPDGTPQYVVKRSDRDGGKRLDINVNGTPSKAKAVYTQSEQLKSAVNNYRNAYTDKNLIELDDANLFHKLITQSKSINKFGASVHVYEPGEYAQMRLFITPDGKAGVALKPDGDLVSGFSNQEVDKPRRIAQLLGLAIKEGAIKADSFDTVLPQYYIDFGLLPVAQDKWNEEFKPEKWDKEVFKQWNNGEPDVIYYVYKGGDRSTISERAGEFGSWKDLKKDVPYAEYDDAVKIQQQSIKSKAQLNPLDSNKGIDNKDFQDYDGMFSKENASSPYITDLLNDEVNGKRGYQLFYKRRLASIEMMSPEEYLRRVRVGQNDTVEGQKRMIFQAQKDRIIVGIEKGDKIDMPSLSYDNKGNFDTQEGRHRATIAKERGEKLIPVVIERGATEKDLMDKAQEIINEANKDLKTNDIDEIINYATDKFNLHRDALAYLNDNASELKTEVPKQEQKSVGVGEAKAEIISRSQMPMDKKVSDMKDILKEYVDEGKSLDEIKDILKDEFGDYYDDVKGIIDQAHQEMTTTGIKNAVTERERGERGLEEIEVEAKRSFGKVFDDAKQMIANGVANGLTLAAEIIKNPRPLKAEESAVLLIDRMRISNEYNKKNAELIEAQENGETSKADIIQSQMEALEEEMDLNDEAARKSGYEQGLGLAARRMLIAQDYSLVTQMNRLKAANGGKEVPKQYQEQLQTLITQLEEANNKLEKLEKTQAGTEKQTGLSKVAKVSRTPEQFEKEKQSIKSKIATKWGQTLTRMKSVIKGRSQIVSKSAVTPQKQAQLESIVKDVNDMVKLYAESGITDLKKIIDNVHQDLSNSISGIDRVDIEDIVLGKYDTQKPKTPLTPAKIQAQANVRRVKTQIDLLKEELKLKQRGAGEKGMDYLHGWHRMAILSGAPGALKISTAAITRGIVTRTENIVGQALALIPGISKIAAKAPRHGGISASAEAKAFTTWFDKMTKKDVLQTYKTGLSELDYLYGKKEPQAENVPHWMTFFGRLHAAMKLLPKRAEFFRSLEMRTEKAIKDGKNPNDVVVQQELATGAYNDALRAVFMQENIITDVYSNALKKLEKKSPAGASIMRFLLPIVKVPTNYVSEAFEYTPIAGFNALTALIRGRKGMTDEQADYFMRSMKKGLIGTAIIFMGYLNPQAVGGYYTGKRKKDDELEAGDIELFGVKLPHFMLHTPLLEMLQIGATMRRSQDANAAKGKEVSKIDGIPVAFKGLAKQIPFLGTGERVSTALEREGDYRMQYLYSTAQSLFEPQLMQNIADWTDTQEGEVVKRKTETFGEKLKEGIPGLRSSLKEDVSKYSKKESKQFEGITDKGLNVPDLSRRASYKIKIDESHPEGVMTENEYDAFVNKVKEYEKEEYTTFSDRYSDELNELKRLQSIKDISASDKADMSKLKDKLQDKIDAMHNKAIKKAKREIE
jgi:hypothetical protein